ncbi:MULTISPECIES: glycosyltransferase family 2 protein [unclassified Frigoribacterium]|uniref:glycosyltransferase family 2 protein n=1 Tax=unclassified Frigoribacterium TaxID=2627005 RepID=UPI0006F23709|nr:MULTISPECIES: glycosyltransferase family 2 protein [unclassified Frigoribacterium]KQM25570.1 hypothetical protein ASL10_08510 [Frigoribacterium sp. Leaf8]WAC51013.1 glycosyltransferase family 2 protein [Frigoribacterium sp. SL97]
MDASVIVVNWRQPELTLRCLESLVGQRASASFEIVLVENEASPGGTEPFRRLVPDLVVVEEATNAGFAGGVRRGIEASRGDVVVLLNNDAVAEPGFVEAGLAALRAGGPRVAAASATVTLEGGFVRATARDEGALVDGRGTAWLRSSAPEAVGLLNGTGVELAPDGNGRDRDWLRPSDDVVDHPADPFGFSGGAAFVRRTALEAVGGFDEGLFMYYEDLDVSWRLRLAGLEIVHAASARTIHRHAASSAGSGALVRRQSMRNRLLVVVRNGSAGFVARVTLRTLARLLIDLARPRGAQLSRRDWGSVCRGLPSAVAGALVSRRRSGVTRGERRRVEQSLRSIDH